MQIRNIWGVGRNYQAHAAEMKAQPPTSPLIFLKAGSCATVHSNEIVFPHWVEELHHEVELVVKLSSQLHVIEAALALDLTDRKAQTHAKKTGEPWTLAKSFHGACAVTAFFSAKDLDLLIKRKMRLWVNDELRQEESPDKMIFSIPELVTHLKEFFPVCGGDLILTGTPAGVGPIQRGDKVTVELEGELKHTWRVI